MARIGFIRGKADVDPEYQDIVDSVIEVFGNVRGPFSVLLHSPLLADRVLGLVKFNREACSVESKLRSLAILATVRERESEYVWAAQVGAARRAGVREEAIDVLRAKGDPNTLLPEERDIVVYAQQLACTNRVDKAVFDVLDNRYGTPWLVELTAVANFFGFLSGMTNAFEVPVAEGGDRFSG
ncbi:MAG TPA: hypothetical protein VN702_16275 [Acetobacteraceae bacterium]|nr:hypothetical protein [Acetobacteraceae bacterium]